MKRETNIISEQANKALENMRKEDEGNESISCV